MKIFLLALFIPLFLMGLNAPLYAANKPATVKHVFGVHGLSCPFCAVGIKKTFKKTSVMGF